MSRTRARVPFSLAAALANENVMCCVVSTPLHLSDTTQRAASSWRLWLARLGSRLGPAVCRARGVFVSRGARARNMANCALQMGARAARRARDKCRARAACCCRRAKCATIFNKIVKLPFFSSRARPPESIGSRARRPILYLSARNVN